MDEFITRKRYLEPGQPFVVPRRARRDGIAASTAGVQGGVAETTASEGECSATENAFHVPTAELVETDERSVEGSPCFDVDICAAPIEPGRESESDDTESESGVLSDDGGEEETVREESDGEEVAAEAEDDAQDADPCFDQLHDLSNEKFEPNSSFTKAEVIVLVMLYVSAFSITWQQLDGLVQLLATLMGAKWGLPTSAYHFRKLWKVSGHTYHFYCQQCFAYLGERQTRPIGKEVKRCPECNNENNIASLTSGLFTILDIGAQVKSMLRIFSREVAQMLERRSSCKHTMDDIGDGRIFQALLRKGKVGLHDLTLLVNTDGSPTFKSTRFSIWPILAVLNELPAKLRWQNVILCGLWFGKKHPSMELLIKKFADVANVVPKLTWKWAGRPVVSTVHVLYGCFDSPARAAVTNAKQFNGRFGCTWCLHQGQTVKGTMKYPVGGELPGERTAAMTSKDGLQALRSGQDSHGIKGPTALSLLPNFDIVWGVSVDYMHAVLLGVTRQLTEHWLQCTSADCYIGAPKTLHIIESTLCSIRPPISFTRLPRPLKEWKDWKASEWKNWLLFYAPVTLKGTLPTKYLHHFELLSQSVFTMLRTSVSSDDIDRVNGLLVQFVCDAQLLYGNEFMTFNVHQLLHLPKCVKKMGPLWAHSCFPFESMNGRLLKLITAAKGVPLQILERYSLRQKVHQLSYAIIISESAKTACTRICKKNFPLMFSQHYTKNMVLSSPSTLPLTAEENAAVSEKLGSGQWSCCVYDRLKVGGRALHAECYSRPTRTCTSYVFIPSLEHYGRIAKVLEVTCNAESSCLLLCELVRVSNTSLPHIHAVRSGNARLCVCDPIDVKVCVFINTGKLSYICDIPNNLESD
ncbi:uncharacterized protein LOC135387052 [Ornithodoros turicata]|uniref:uncharacterized protein LOC135387052 n=1 Tax=Ornithodoros turicata TaxID=34597 RepID=UPI0031395A9F